MNRPTTVLRRALGRGLLGCAGVAVVLLTVVLLWQWATWPDVARLAHRNPDGSAFMRRWVSRHAGGPSAPRLLWRWVPSDRISPHLKRAVLVGEDINFFSHGGFSVDDLHEAVREAVRGERFRGASTITQQVAKNLWLSPSRNPFRKLKEAVLTVQLERALDKRRILEIHLNVAQFGPHVFGAEAAAWTYFGTPAAGLGPAEAAQLAAALPRPSSWHPGVDSRGYRAHVSRIRRRMARADWIDRHL